MISAGGAMRTRLTKGTSRKVFHRLYSKADRRAYVWAMNLKPGEIINSFDAWNHEVSRVEILRDPVWITRFGLAEGRGKTPRGTFVSEVVIHSTNGWMHHISETGCIEPGFSVAKLESIMGKTVMAFMQEAGVVDGRGVRLRSATDDEKTKVNELYEAEMGGLS